MKILSRLLVLALASSASVLAHAGAIYETSFTVTDGVLPHLRTNLDHMYPTPVLGGSWQREVQQSTLIRTRDLLSETVDPMTGEVSRTWGPTQYDENRDRSPVAPLSVGHDHAFVFGPNDSTSTTGGATIGTGGLHATLTTRDRPVEASVSADWSKNFSLDANSSFTFSGIARLTVTGDAAPAVANTHYDLDASGSFASLTLADDAGRLWSRIGASVFGDTAGLTNLFSYDIGPDGFMALTVTNSRNVALAGTVKMASFIGLSPTLAAPVPEPGMLFLMLAGAAVVGVGARRSARVKPDLIAA